MGDLNRAQIGANWLAQFSRALDLHSEIADSRPVHLQTIGLVSANAHITVAPAVVGQINPQQPVGAAGFNIMDEVSVVDLETSFGLVSRTDNSGQRRAAVHAIAATAAALEGSVVEQLTNAPDTSSTARRLAWGNTPEVGETPDTASRRVYSVSANAPTDTVTSVIRVENLLTGSQPAFQGQPALPTNFVTTFKTRLANSINAYSAAGFEVVTSGEALLGPGHRSGSEFLTQITQSGMGSASYSWERKASLQNGGALIATQYDAAGDPERIAHILTRYSGSVKGGGGTANSNASVYQASKAADVLKDRFVDRSTVIGVRLDTGAVGYATPVLDSIGQGEGPYRVERRVELKGGGLPKEQFLPDDLAPRLGGLVTNWDGSADISGSGHEAMGASRPETAVYTVAAFAAAQDIWKAARSPQRELSGALVMDWWTRQMAGNVVTVAQGAASEQFVRTPAGFINSEEGAATVQISGARSAVRPALIKYWPVQGRQQDEAVTRVWNMQGMSITRIGAEKDQRTYGRWQKNRVPPSHNYDYYEGFRLSNWSYPYGVNVTLSYAQDIEAPQSFVSPSSVTVGGRTLSFPIFDRPVCGATAQDISIPDIDLKGTRLDFLGSRIGTSTQRPVADCLLRRVFEPVAPSKAALEYRYGDIGIVTRGYDATALQSSGRDYYAFAIAEDYSGARRDPEGGWYTVESLQDGEFSRTIDELARVTTTILDGRGRELSRTYPEGDKDEFGYDGRDNVTLLRRNPKPGSTLAPIEITAAYEASWNKLSWIKDGKGQQTDFTYHATGTGASLMATARRPLVNGARPTYTFVYAKPGLLTREVDASGVTTDTDYNTAGDRTSLKLGASVVGANPALNLTTTYSTNAKGDPTLVTNARGYATEYEYDLMRRPRREVRRDGGVTTAILAETRTVYDENGRVLQQRRASRFDATGQANRFNITHFEYTPTGQLSRETNEADESSYSFYDGLDRLSRYIDPAGQVSARTYDLAGQILQERSGVGTPLEQATATYTYSPNGKLRTLEDARGNVVETFYDGHNRVRRVLHPDATDEEYQYDANDNLTRLTNRGGRHVHRTFDAVDRKISEYGETNQQPNRATRPWDIATRTFNYDAAGRLTSAVATDPLTNTIESQETYAYDAAGRLREKVDGLGTWVMGWSATNQVNYQKYADGTEIRYTHDGMDRLEEATFKLPGSTSFSRAALLTWDPLSRRRLVSFGDNTTQAYEYDAADRIISIAHDFNRPLANVTFDYEYDPAGREIGRTVSNPDYLAPPQPALTYGVADATNRYPSVDGQTLTWWNEGPLNAWGTRRHFYDEENRLARVQDGSDQVAFSRDALSRTRRRTRSNNGVQTWASDHGRDGLRPEIALERLWSTQGSLLGHRRYVLGPNPDERLGFMNVSETWFPHTDRQGTLIGLSRAGEPVQKFALDAWGAPAQASDVAEGSAPNAYPFRYTGQALDPWTLLYDYKARAYSTALGRFLQPDPLGPRDGPNLYAYVANDPMNQTDPLGLCSASRLNTAEGSICGGSSFDRSSITSNDTGGGGRGSTAQSPQSRPAAPVNPGVMDQRIADQGAKYIHSGPNRFNEHIAPGHGGADPTKSSFNSGLIRDANTFQRSVLLPTLSTPDRVLPATRGVPGSIIVEKNFGVPVGTVPAYRSLPAAQSTTVRVVLSPGTLFGIPVPGFYYVNTAYPIR